MMKGMGSSWQQLAVTKGLGSSWQPDEWPGQQLAGSEDIIILASGLLSPARVGGIRPEWFSGD